MKLNEQDAKKSEGQRINTSGAYVCKIKRAELITSTQKKSKGVEFSVVSRNGETADYIQIWYEKANGEKLPGYYLIQAAMALCGIQEITELAMAVKKYNSETRKEEDAHVNGYPQFFGKVLGFLLQKEEYTKSNGNTGTRLNVVAFFHPDTNQTAGEFIDKKEAKFISSRNLVDKKIEPTASVPAQQQSYNSSLPPDFTMMDDDIPF